MQENKEQTEEKQSEQQSEEVQILFSPDINEIIIGSGDCLAVKYIHGYGRDIVST